MRPCWCVWGLQGWRQQKKSATQPGGGCGQICNNSPRHCFVNVWLLQLLVTFLQKTNKVHIFQIKTLHDFLSQDQRSAGKYGKERGENTVTNKGVQGTLVQLMVVSDCGHIKLALLKRRLSSSSTGLTWILPRER